MPKTEIEDDAGPDKAPPSKKKRPSKKKKKDEIAAKVREIGHLHPNKRDEILELLEGV